MKERINYYYNIIKNFFNNRNLFYLIISILIANVFNILDTVKKYGFSYNLYFDLNKNFYLVFLVLIILYFSYFLINNLKNRVELITRFSSSKGFFKFIFGNVISLVTFIYILNLIVFLLFRSFKHLFIYDNAVYFVYNFSVYKYIIWQIIRNYIYIFFVSYLITFVSLYCHKKSIVYITLFEILLPLILINTNCYYIFFSSFLATNNYGSLINEISYFMASYIIKYFLVLLIYQLTKYFNYNKIKIYLCKYFDALKKVYLPLIIYILINLLNIILLKSGSYNINDYEILCTSNFANLGIVGFALKCISLSCFTLIICKLIFIDLKENACILFTRISKKDWLFKKITNFLIILVLFRLPLYIYVTFSNIIWYDLIIYMLLLFYSVSYSIKENNITLSFLIIGLLLISIFIYSNTLIFILLFLSFFLLLHFFKSI